MFRTTTLPFCILLLFFTQQLSAQLPTITLTPFASGFNDLTDIANAGDERVFIVEQAGYIHIADQAGNVNPVPFLNIDPLVINTGNERGLLGLAFHPDYANNGYFYLNYNNNSGTSIISRWSVSVNPDSADENSEVILMTISQPFSNHNGGCIKFGNDGYLYIGMGDGGSGGDPGNRAQNPMELLGKMLRIDVDSGTPYGIPVDNPYVGNAAVLDEIWAIGVRNPWRFSFDALLQDLWIADVGQNAWEEIDFQPANSPGGHNYGWRCYEGNNAYNLSGCSPISAYDFPVFEYPNNGATGCSVTGGFVYRGAQHANLYGHYLHTDYCTGIIWSTVSDSAGGFITNTLGNFTDFEYTTFGEDVYGELYLAEQSGTVMKIGETACLPVAYVYSATGDTSFCEGDSLELVSPYGVGHTYQWSVGGNTILGANSHNYFAKQPGAYMVSVRNASFCSNNSTSYTVSMIPAPQVGFVGLPSGYCEDAAADTLSANPAGGIFSGTGVSNDVFDPQVAGIGQQELIYAFTDTNGCSNADSQMVEVFALPVVSISSLDPSYCNSDPADTLIGNPSGGTFSGPGVFGTTFDPALAGVDTHWVSYMYVDSNACASSDSQSVIVEICTGMTGIEGISGVDLFPNPNAGQFTLLISASQSGEANISLFNLLGEKVLAEKHLLKTGREMILIDASLLQTGIYFLRIETERGSMSEKVFIWK